MLYNPKSSILFITLFLIMSSSLLAQTENSKWKLNIQYASMKPFFQNDQWFVTSEGYHLHPRTEDYTPGIYVGLERSLMHRIGLELSILYGLPPATLGVIDEYSASDYQFEETERYHFFAVLFSPNIYLLSGKSGAFYISPTIGFGMLSEKSITPTIGPRVTWTAENALIYGARAGIKIRLKNSAVFFNAECLLLSMKTRVEENQTNRELEKKFGPFGLLLGISYVFK